MAVRFLKRAEGVALAYRHIPGAAPGLFWLSGFNSAMTATKAAHLAGWAEAKGRAYTAFDYSGRGQSEGDATAITISRWRADALAVFDAVAEGSQILVGSSTGGWIALHLALDRPERVKGLVLLAPATDFTEDLLWERASPEMRAQIESDGGLVVRKPPPGEAPHPFTKALIEDGRRNLLLRSPMAITAPVHIIQGRKDTQIPYERTLLLAERLEQANVTVELTVEGDHHLSTPADLARLERALERMTVPG